jgi:hypothetical protein
MVSSLSLDVANEDEFEMKVKAKVLLKSARNTVVHQGRSPRTHEMNHEKNRDRWIVADRS